MIGTLADLMAALQALGDAAYLDDRSAYLAALGRARAEQATDEQIRDARAYRCQLRITRTALPPTTFDWQGEAL